MDRLDDQHKRILLSYSDDIDVLKFCLTNKNIRDKVCNEEFWKNRFIKKYGNFNKGDISWKNLYINIIAVKDKAKRKNRSVLYYAVKTKNSDVLNFFLYMKYSFKDYLDGLEAAAEINDEKLIKTFLEVRTRKESNDLNLYHYNLQENTMAILKGAVNGGNKNLVEKYFYDTRVFSTDDFINLIKLAIKNKENEIAIFIYENAPEFNKSYLTDQSLFISVENKNIPLMKYFLEKGGDVNFGLKAAVKIDNSELIRYFISKGAQFK